MFRSESYYFAKLTQSVKNGITKSEILLPFIEGILSSSTFASRYKIINAVELVQGNCCSNFVQEASALITALSILEKYGKNLLRLDPPAQWKIVRLSNAIFHTKVDNIKGSRKILMQMGYTERIDDGFAFPLTVGAPNRDHVTIVTSEIILLKFELAMLQKSQHPYPEHILSLLVYHHDPTTFSPPAVTKQPAKKPSTVLTPQPSTSKQHSHLSMDDLCVVCGLKTVEFHCHICKTQRCGSCDKMWHSNPSRLNHKRTRIRPLTKTSSTAESTSYQSPLTFLTSVTTNGEVFSGTAKPHPSRSVLNKPTSAPARMPVVQSSGDAPRFLFDRPSYSSAMPVASVSSVNMPSTQQTAKWEDRFLFKKQELASITSPDQRMRVLENFCAEVDNDIDRFRNRAKEFSNSSSVRGHLLERSEFLQQEKEQLKMLFPISSVPPLYSIPVQQPVDEVSLTDVAMPGSVRPTNENTNYGNSMANVSDNIRQKSTDNRFNNERSHSLNSYNSFESQPLYPGPFSTNKGLIAEKSTVVQTKLPFPSYPKLMDTMSPTDFLVKQDKIKHQIMQEEFRISCLETVNHLRAAESNGFTPNHLQIAIQELERENNIRDSPLDWLSKHFSQRIQQMLERNPGSSLEEVATIFCGCDGNFEQTEKIIAEKLVSRKASLIQPKFFDEKTFVNSLVKASHNYGKALIEVQRPFMQDFLDRIESPSRSDKLFVKDFLALEDHDHIRDSLVSVLCIRDPVVTNMMCAILFQEPSVSNDSEEFLQALGEFEIKDVLEAAQSFPNNIDWSLKYLSNKCSLCLELYSKNKVECMTTCGDNGCTYCRDCLAKYLEIEIREGNVRDLVCPVCKLPDIDVDEETAINHFNHIDVIVKAKLDEKTYALFQKKLRDQTLMKMPNFRWCSHCENGFLYERNENNLKMVCSACRKATCYNCKKPWEVQHEGLSCQDFLKWKQMNDTDFQAQGLAAHLRENGIDCPSCNFRYALAKGGCMHFKCLTCSFQFCSGCKSPFKQGQVCTVYKDCFKKGFHSHHPRDCLFYLRDLEIERLQQILSHAEIFFDTESKRGDNFCQVPEQKETSTGPDGRKLHDDVCGREVHKDNADLCDVHYKEYLVNLINNNHLDPATVFNINELETCLKRSKKEVPTKPPEVADEQFRLRLLAAVETLPLIHQKNNLDKKQNENLAPE